MNRVVAVVLIVLLAVGGYLAWQYFSNQEFYRASLVIWELDKTSDSSKRATIEKVELVSEQCDRVTFKVSYQNSGETLGYIRFNVSAKPAIEGARGDHSVTLKQDKGSDNYEVWISEEVDSAVTTNIWVSLEEIVDKKFHDIVDRVKVPLDKTWGHGC